MFLDDGFGCAHSFKKTMEMGQAIKNDILKSGLIPNAIECIWFPALILQFSGVVLDSAKGKIVIPERRVSKAKNTLSALMLSVEEYRKVPVRMVANLVGQIISMSIVYGHILRANDD